MEQFLRNYYTNLNPNATEEEILAFLTSQGFGGMGDFSGQVTTGLGGITNINPRMTPEFGGSGGIDNIITGAGTGTGNITDLFDFIKSGGITGAVIRGAGNLVQDFVDRRAGRLDETPDSGIMPGIETGAAEGSDAGFSNTQSNESFNADANVGTSDYGYV
jgi:hypothetical protein